MGILTLPLGWGDQRGHECDVCCVFLHSKCQPTSDAFYEGCDDSSTPLLMSTEIWLRVAEINMRTTDNWEMLHILILRSHGIYTHRPWTRETWLQVLPLLIRLRTQDNLLRSLVVIWKRYGWYGCLSQNCGRLIKVAQTAYKNRWVI